MKKIDKMKTFTIIGIIIFCIIGMVVGVKLIDYSSETITLGQLLFALSLLLEAVTLAGILNEYILVDKKRKITSDEDKKDN